MEDHFPSVQFYKDSTGTYILYALQDTFTILFNSIIKANFSIVDSPIINFQYKNWDYTTNFRYDRDTIHQIWDANFQVCYTMQANNSERRNLQALFAIIYVNAIKDMRPEVYETGVRSLQSTGVRVGYWYRHPGLNRT